MTNSIYIAAPWTDRADIPAIAERLEKLGWTITHKWWLVEEEGADMSACAKADMKGVMDAKCILLINSSKSEGKAVEQGIALARNIPIIAVGVRGEHSKNVFHHLPLYYWTEKLDTALDILSFVKEMVNR